MLHLCGFSVNFYLPDSLIRQFNLILHSIYLSSLLLYCLLQVLQSLFIVVIVIKLLVHLPLELTYLYFERFCLKVL